MKNHFQHLSLVGIAALTVLAASGTAQAQRRPIVIPPLPQANPPRPPANPTYLPSPAITPLGPVTPNYRPNPGQYRLGVEILVNQTGAQVLRAFPGGAGEGMGLEPGDVIVHINGQPVTSLPLYHRLLDNCGGDAQVTVWKPSVQQYESWQVSWNEAVFGGAGGPSVRPVRSRGR
jgi:hypothetical protein